MILPGCASGICAGSYCFDSNLVSASLVLGPWADVAGCLGSGRRPGVAPAGEVLFFASPKKSTQKKGDPQSATPSRCEGANLRRGGCGVRRGTRSALARAAQTSTASQFTKHGRSDAHATPQPPRRRRSQQGWGAEHPNSHTGHRCARPRLRSAWRLRPRDGAERSAAKQWPVWMSAPGVPFWMRLGRAGRGVACVPKDTHAS